MEIVFVLIGLVFLLAIIAKRRFGFVGQRPQDYANGTAQFDIRQHLNGALGCDGVIYGPTGRVRSRFHGDFQASWTGNTGVMKEVFRYDSGAVQHREWQLTLGNDGAIRALADDVVGEGTGHQMGDAVVLNYALRLPADAGGHVLNAVDWMYLAPGGVIVNRSQFRKFGIKVAELVATMHQKETA